MPDLLTHVIVGLIIAELFRVKKKSLVILGAALPDILYKFKLLGFFVHIPESFFVYGLLPFHSPAGLLIVSMLLPFLFAYPWHKSFGLLSAGWVSHMLLDLTNRNFMFIQTYLLFPFSYRPFGLGMFWPDEYIIPLLFFTCLLLIIYIIENFYKKSHITRKEEKQVYGR